MVARAAPVCVLDASVAGGWIFPAQNTTYKKAVLAAITQASALVPALWHIEVANMLVKKIKVGQLSQPAIEPLLSYVDGLSLVTEELEMTQAARAKIWTVKTQVLVAIKHGLTSYDAAYLALAMRSGLPLATTDEALVQAAKRSGVPIFQP
jgi:predicted nucleic acid-binding protein